LWRLHGGGCLSPHTGQENEPIRTAAEPTNSPEQRKKQEEETMIHSTEKQKLTHAELFSSAC
jgi:hypothetical protein